MDTKRLLKLINDLSHHDSSKRRSAASGLSEGDERAVYPLVKALTDESRGVQDAAMRSLVSIGGEITAYMVLPLLRDEAALRNMAAVILLDIGQPAIPVIYPLFKDKDDDIRKFAVDILADIKTQVSPKKILPLIYDTNPNVRASAAKAMGRLGYKEAVPSLLKALVDEEWVCFSVLEALGELKDESSVDAIGGLLHNKSELLRYAVIETLGKIGSPTAADLLLKHLSKVDGLEKSAVIKSLLAIGVTPSVPGISDFLLEMFVKGDWEDKLICLNAMVKINEHNAINTIINVAGSLEPSDPDSEERIAAIKNALRTFGCVDSLIDALANPSVKYRGKVIAIEVIGDLGCRSAVRYLIDFLDVDLRDVRRASINAIAKIAAGDGEFNEGKTDMTARSHLLSAVDASDSHVRKAAVNALARIGDKAAFNPIFSLFKKEKYRDIIEDSARALLVIDKDLLLQQSRHLDESLKEVINLCLQEI